MTFKQAHSEMRQVIKALRPFEKLEAVLNAAVMAEQAEAGAQERTRVLEESAGKWEVAVETARVQYAADHATAGEERDRFREVHSEEMQAAKLEAEVYRSACDNEAAEMLSTAEGKKKILIAECRALEEQRETLKDKLVQAQLEYAAMLKKLGVTNG